MCEALEARHATAVAKRSTHLRNLRRDGPGQLVVGEREAAQVAQLSRLGRNGTRERVEGEVDGGDVNELVEECVRDGARQ